jgi:hypothetical protein
MEKKPAVRNYFFPDATLVVKANNILTCARRDATEFALRNMTEANTFTPFEQAKDAFKNLPTDDELVADQQDATDVKNKQADVIKVQIRTVMTAAKGLFGEGSAKYNRFGTKGMDGFGDPELLKCTRRVARTCENFAAPLATKGITAATVNNLKTLATDFEEAIDKQQDAINDRNIAAEERVEMGNDVFAQMMNIADTGKDIWVTTNEAKYNDYVIYNTKSGDKEDPPTPPQG